MVDNKNIERWKFGEKNDYLINLVLTGKKTATTCLYNKNQNSDLYSIICYSNDQDACLIKTKKIFIMKFCEMKWKLAKLEGENKNLNEWFSEHKKFFKKEDVNFTKDTLIEFEIFEVIKKF